MSLQRVKTERDHLVEVFRALGDPIRAGIMARIAMVEELPCTALEASLPVSKSTISYHMKILYHADLVDIRKDGRNYYYHARREAIERAFPGLWDCLLRLGSEDNDGALGKLFRTEDERSSVARPATRRHASSARG